MLKDACECTAPHLLPIYSFMLQIFSLYYTFHALGRAGRGFFLGVQRITSPEGLHLQTPNVQPKGWEDSKRSQINGLHCIQGAGSVLAVSQPLGTQPEKLRSSHIRQDILRSLTGFKKP